VSKKKPVTTDIEGKLILLGTGTSVGVPAIGCGCDTCQSDHPRNKRTRSSAIFGLPEGNLLVDTSPDLYQQLIRGFDDLRLFQFYLGHPVPVYCNDKVETRLKQAFEYAFSGRKTTHKGAAPAVDMHRIGDEPLEILGAKVTPIPLKHGPLFDVLGFRIGNVAYCTDVSHIPESSFKLLEGVEVLVLDALRSEPHPTHFTIDQAIEVANRIGAKKTWFTHCACKINYEVVNPTLPEGIEIGYDGLQIDLV